MKMLEGKVAIITGSGRGIGAETAKLFAEQGASLIISDIDEAPARETAEYIASKGGTANLYIGDVTDRDFPSAIVAKAAEIYGGLDILVNGAGYTWDGMVHTMSDTQWEAVIDVHLNAPFRMIRAAAHIMREQAKKEMVNTGVANVRKVINISSNAALYGNIGQSNYGAGKAGLIGLTRVVAREWGCFNICVNAVAFGWMDTRLTADIEKGEKMTVDGREIRLGIPQKGIEMRKKLIALGRPGTPEEAAGPILFLASPLSNYVTGHVLVVTGGR
jgi:3-oxoacyl-[acyl-carrier protein] reductase